MLFFSGFARTFSFFWELGINLAEFSSIIYILKEDFYIIFPEFAPAAAFVVLLAARRSAATRPCGRRAS